MGIVPSKRRWERKMRARDRSVKFQGHAANNVDKVRSGSFYSKPIVIIPYVFAFSAIFQQSTLDRKKKNFTFSRKFPFMKSKDDKNEDGSDQERKYLLKKIVACNFSSHFDHCIRFTLSLNRLFRLISINF